jgi:trimethylguanosine synthase
MGADRIIDAFAGAGGNVVQFAKVSKVVAIELQPSRLELLRHNAQIYDVTDNVQFLEGDFFHHAETLEPSDVLFLSPPWGGPSYLAQEAYDVEEHMTPTLGKILAAGQRLSRNVVCYLPRNTDLLSVVTVLASSELAHKLEVQLYYLDGKFKALACFMGDFVDYDCNEAASLLIEAFGLPRAYPRDPYLAVLACAEDLESKDFDVTSALFTAAETEPPRKKVKQYFNI